MAMVAQQMENTGNTTPEVAVIILNWNGEKLLREFLPKVTATTDASISCIIVADNGSTDGSLAYLESEGAPRVEVMKFDRNYGFAEGYNRAIAAVADRFRYAVLLNSDVATSAGWDKELLQYMKTHMECAACQPKILSYRNPGYFEYAGAAGGFIDRNGYPYCRGRIFATCERDTGQYNDTRLVHWASGACLMVRTDAYLAAGGLDTKFFAHMEEIDLCWRLRLAGYAIAAVTSAAIYHLGGGSLPAENPRKTYLNFRNNLLMLYKNLPDSCRRGFLFRRRLLDTLAWAMYVAKFDFANASAIVKAHRDFVAMRRTYTAHPAEMLLGADAESSVNIITAYYLHGKKKFSELGF